MPEFVSLEVSDGVAVVRLDRPPVNAIDRVMGLELLDAFGEVERREEVGALVIWGGPKIFAAGADIKSMAELGPEEIRPVVSALGDALDLLETMPKISIAAVEGYALGGGFELALAADLRYLGEGSSIGQPELTLGVIPGAGGTQRITQLSGAGVARDLVYTGRIVGAQEAKALLLCNRVMDSGSVFESAMADARRFAKGPREALAAAKAAIRAAVLTPGTAGLAVEKDLFCSLFGTHDQREGMRAFLDKREPRFGTD
jgi:enoyl-CoA hydratase/carnithine racemase